MRSHTQQHLQPVQLPPFFTQAWVLLVIILIYGIPIFLAYHFASFIEPVVESYVLEPLSGTLTNMPAFVQTLFMGDYGLISLGTFSFVWAFPVVLFVGVSIALAEETGLQTKLVRGSDPLLRKIGLTGSDLVPVLTGYGCNVVAIMQTKGCHACSQKHCVSMVSFGSACSYQIGATLSIFNAVHAPWMFIPYIGVLFVAGACHTRIWYGKPRDMPLIFPGGSRLRKPAKKRVVKKLTGMLNQFFYQAMPVFLLICFIAFLLDEFKIMAFVIGIFEPVFSFFSLPVEAAVAIFFSVLRKDGILLFNEGGGAMLATFSILEIFVVVYLASTLSGCLVTIWTIGKQMGVKAALSVTGKQATTSVLSALVMLVLVRLITGDL
ncbi:ferrous iron transporter B [Bacillus sp. H-16]|uniref:nucleoside recognition domain-containing protein n=1 Tax=Alteribacter salitolerans TaxID=2912333 RepID=UPI001964B1F9|nr:nucleoside recognition domain-containing protein [Alteribacter salitolerans]MBM7095254.1 ferrous iron transporter B [Alteribacter salitolerans]